MFLGKTCFRVMLQMTSLKPVSSYSMLCRVVFNTYRWLLPHINPIFLTFWTSTPQNVETHPNYMSVKANLKKRCKLVFIITYLFWNNMHMSFFDKSISAKCTVLTSLPWGKAKGMLKELILREILCRKTSIKTRCDTTSLQYKTFWTFLHICRCFLI